MRKIRDNNSGVYLIKNLSNGKVYVGSTIDLVEREYRHFNELDKNKHINKHLQYAFNKYGKDNFNFKIIEYIEKIDDINKFKDILLEREQYWIDTLDTSNKDKGYNLNKKAESCLGIKRSEETKQKMSEIRKVQFMGEGNPFYGKHHSEESKKKMSSSHKGRFIGENNSFYGKHHTEEARAKMSQTHLNNNSSRGENNHATKLIDEQVVLIKMILKENKFYDREIGEMFNVSRIIINSIKLGKTWKHIRLDKNNDLKILDRITNII